MKHHVKIQLTTATPRHVDRISNGGFFVAGAAVSHDGQFKAVVTMPLSVGASQVGEFHSPENILFDGALDDDGRIAIVLVARHDVVSKDWRTRGEWVEAIEDSIANADARGVAAIAERIAAGDHVGRVVLVGAIGIGLSLGIYFPVLASDTDLLLGQLTTVIDGGGAASETFEWLCEENGASHAIRYTVTRRPIEAANARFAIETKRRELVVSIDSATIVRGQSARLTVSAVDALTGSPVAGTVRLLDVNRAFPTNVPYDATFQSAILTAIRGAIALGFARMPLDNLFDDEFDWRALDHRTPKGLVTADGYDATAVRFDLS